MPCGYREGKEIFGKVGIAFPEGFLLSVRPRVIFTGVFLASFNPGWAPNAGTKPFGAAGRPLFGCFSRNYMNVGGGRGGECRGGRVLSGKRDNTAVVRAGGKAGP